MALLSKYLTPERVTFLRSRSKDGAIRELVHTFVSTIPELKADAIFRAVQERERIVSSWIAPGIAIPHARISGWNGMAVALGRSRKGIAFDSSDGNPVHLLVLIVSDDSDPDQHIMLLAEIARTLRDLALKQLVLTARSSQEVYRLMLTHGFGEPRGRAKTSPKVRLSRLLFAHALSVAEEVKANAVMLHCDAVGSLRFIEDITSPIQLILVSSDKATFNEERKPAPQMLQVPFPSLNRSNQMELSLLFAISRGLVSRNDTVVHVSGVPNSGLLDTLLVIDVGREFPGIFTQHTSSTIGDVEPQVLEKILQIATDISREGREGRPVGTIFMIGDYNRVLKYCRQMVINPFRGYREEEKNILDPSLSETVKEFSTIDGAFIIKGDGVIMSAGTFLRPQKTPVNLASGLGARHAAAAALTSITGALAVVISQSTGTMSLFKAGALMMALERPKG
jgi:DNA integrity scanning protein DisA with diadenylate cyclase activity/mannitol/fructose-specific phosphotransferase system IIA component (Ntr-type)